MDQRRTRYLYNNKSELIKREKSTLYTLVYRNGYVKDGKAKEISAKCSLNLLAVSPLGSTKVLHVL
jgi:hypothetical protein